MLADSNFVYVMIVIQYVTRHFIASWLA